MVSEYRKKKKAEDQKKLTHVVLAERRDKWKKRAEEAEAKLADNYRYKQVMINRSQFKRLKREVAQQEFVAQMRADNNKNLVEMLNKRNDEINSLKRNIQQLTVQLMLTQKYYNPRLKGIVKFKEDEDGKVRAAE